MTATTFFPRFARAILLSLLLSVIAPLSIADNLTAADYYEDALQRSEQGDVKGAIIQLKNALQLDPKMLSAQVLLGESYLRDGTPAAAEAAFFDAEKMGADRSLIAPRLAKALYQQFKFQPLLDRIRTAGLPASALSEVQVYRAYALLELGQPKEAMQAVEQALAADPSSTQARVSKGTVLLRSGDLSGASALSDQLVRQTPDDAAVWKLQASVAHLSGDVRKALGAYDKAIGLQPDNLDARIARTSLLFDLKRDKEAKEDLDYLSRNHAQDPRAAYLLALAAARRNDSEGTRKALTNVTAAVDQIPSEIVNRNVQLLMLGGLAHYGLKEPEKAQSYLSAYIQLQPRQPGARKLLASILLTEGEYNGTIDLLDPIVTRGLADAQTLSLLASAYMGRKDYIRASRLLEEAERLSDGDVGITTSLGLSQLGAGHEKMGLTYLEQAYRKSPSNTRVGLALTVAYLRVGNSSQAAAIARQLAKREPDNPLVLGLLGDALLASRDGKGARAAYEQAARDKSLAPVILSLARLDMLERKWDAARQRLDALLKKETGNTSAMFEMARLEAIQGRTEEAIRWLDKARVLPGAGLRPGLYLVELYIRAGEGKKALNVATELEAAYPRSMKVLSAVGRAHLAAGDAERARAAFNRMSRYAAFDTPVLYDIARLFLLVNDLDSARIALDKGLTSNPNHLSSQVLMTEIELRTGRLESAEKRARFVRDTWPGSAEGYRLLGGVLMAKRQTGEALTQYKAAFEREKTTAGAISLSQAYVSAGDIKAANTFLEGWLRLHPTDGIVKSILAEGYVRAGDLKAAQETYEALLRDRGRDVGILNNLSYILLRTGDGRQALTYARKAHELAPKDPAVLDTLGWALVKGGQPQEALNYLRDAHLRAAQSAEIRYHLGVALYKLGRKAEAKRELQSALADSAVFDGAEEAKSLLREY
jgi:putative PEP-CTERM system TPR-repeat lipoprotein